MKEKINPDKNLVNSKSGYSQESYKENFEQLKIAYNRILKFQKSELFSKLGKSETDIIDNYLKSYKKKIENIKFTKKDFFLTGQDILKISKITDEDLLRFLMYRYKYSVYPSLFKIDSYPPNIQIEPTSICNFRCVMCYQADKSFSGKSHGYMGHMDLELYKKIHLENKYY